MLFFSKKKFDPSAGKGPILDYIEDVLKARLGVEAGTPSEIEVLPSPERFARRRIGFGRGRDFDVSFYPADKKITEGDERVALDEILRRRVPVPEIVVEDRSPETRKKFGFDVVVCKRHDPRPANDAWTAQDLWKAVDLLRQIHSIPSIEGGRAWSPDNQDAQYLKLLERRWTQALEKVATSFGRKLHPVREAPFREKALGRLDNAAQYDLVHGAPGPNGFLRLLDGCMMVGDFSSMHFAYREWDLILLEQMFFGGECPASKGMIKYYFESTPPAVQKRYETMRPFFLGLYLIEQIADLVPAEQTTDKPKTLSDAEMAEEKARREKASTIWRAFLAPHGVPEK